VNKHSLQDGNSHYLHDLSQEDMLKLTAMIMQLMTHWELDQSTQLSLLGLSKSSRGSLSKYSGGKSALTKSIDVLDRAGYLLAIHKALRLLYPKNRDIVYSWIKLRNNAFDNYTPLEVIQAEGIIGLAKVARYLDFMRGQ
jgi:hypothetical protein